MQLLLLPPRWLHFAVVLMRVVVLMDSRDGMRPYPVDVHPGPEHTSLSVQHPDGIVELLKLLLLVSAFREMRIWKGIVEEDKFGRLYDSTELTEGDGVSDLMVEEARVLLNLGDKVSHLLDDVAGWLGVPEVVDTHADDKVAWFWVMLVRPSPSPAAVPDPSTNNHFTVDMEICLEGRMFPESC